MLEIPVLYLGGYSKCPIGKLTEQSSGNIFFQYDPEWISRGIELSPIYLHTSIKEAVTTPTPIYSKLFGLFSDSLPDWWGVQIMQQFFGERGIPWDKVSLLQQLSCTGLHAMGGIGYLPPPKTNGFREELTVEVAELLTNAQSFIHGKTHTVLPGLMRSGLLAGGAQPKIVLAFNHDFSRAVAGGGHIPHGFERWLLKFDLDPEYQNGKEEQAFAEMARASGIHMAETHLLKCDGDAYHFLSKRFDRIGDERRHVHTYSGMTHTAVRSGLSYESLMELTKKLTHDNTQAEEVFRRACFNILTGNDDDHGKNHAFLMQSNGKWELSPAYDLTHSSNPLTNGARAASILGKNLDITIDDLLQFAKNEDIPDAKNTIDQVIQGIRKWSDIAQATNLAPHRIRQIASNMSGLNA